MKKKFCFAVLSIFMALIVLSASGCYYFKYQMYFYYQDDKHFASVEGFYCGDGTRDDCISITYIIDNNEYHSMDFRLVPQSMQILQDNGFFEEVQEDDAITFTTSFIMFSAGWVYPIVEIWCNEKCYLDYETGKANLVNRYR